MFIPTLENVSIVTVSIKEEGVSCRAAYYTKALPHPALAFGGVSVHVSSDGIVPNLPPFDLRASVATFTNP